ncbi:MAG: hypothetical protein HOQ05_10395 [Corynebacteriales bacterium]|nr:hypothetical protein [Mycobacteriales bacterium]
MQIQRRSGGKIPTAALVVTGVAILLAGAILYFGVIRSGQDEQDAPKVNRDRSNSEEAPGGEAEHDDSHIPEDGPDLGPYEPKEYRGKPNTAVSDAELAAAFEFAKDFVDAFATVRHTEDPNARTGRVAEFVATESQQAVLDLYAQNVPDPAVTTSVLYQITDANWGLIADGFVNLNVSGTATTVTEDGAQQENRNYVITLEYRNDSWRVTRVSTGDAAGNSGNPN